MTSRSGVYKLCRRLYLRINVLFLFFAQFHLEIILELPGFFFDIGSIICQMTNNHFLSSWLSL